MQYFSQLIPLIPANANDSTVFCLRARVVVRISLGLGLWLGLMIGLQMEYLESGVELVE